MDSDGSATAPATGVPGRSETTTAAGPSPRTRVIIGVSFVGVLACAWLATGIPKPFIYAETAHLLAALAVLVFGLYAGWAAHGNPQLGFQLGETVYLLGYVATIAGLGAIALQIGQDHSLLSASKVPTILQRGALALVSTLFGLIGMNLLRWHGQSHDLQRGEAEQQARRLAELIEQVLRRTEVERAKIFLQAFESADLTQQLAAMSANLRAAAESLAAFKSDAHEVKQTWTNVLAGLNRLNGALSQFKELADGLNTSWAGLGEGIRQAPELGRAAQTATAALNQLASAVAQLQQTSAAINTELAPLQAGLKGFRLDADEAMLNWGGVQAALTGLNQALRQFKELADALVASWAGLGEQLAQAPQLGQAVQSTTEALDRLGGAVSQLQQTTAAVNTALAPLQSELANAVQMLQDRLAKLPPLADAVARLVELANKVAPTMEVLSGTYRDIGGINDSLRVLAHSLQTFNDQLNAANNATSDVATNADELIRSTDNLVAEVANQLHKLKSLTEDWGKLGETVKELAPAMKDLKQQLGTVQEFSARVAGLTQALARAEGILTSTTTKLDEVGAVVKDFIDTTRKLLTEGQPALPSDDEK
jgi:chromosome segregation ATPase